MGETYNNYYSTRNRDNFSMISMESIKNDNEGLSEYEKLSPTNLSHYALPSVSNNNILILLVFIK